MRFDVQPIHDTMSSVRMWINSPKFGNKHPPLYVVHLRWEQKPKSDEGPENTRGSANEYGEA
jgi:hypothetical protein